MNTFDLDRGWVEGLVRQFRAKRKSLQRQPIFLYKCTLKMHTRTCEHSSLSPFTVQSSWPVPLRVATWAPGCRPRLCWCALNPYSDTRLLNGRHTLCCNLDTSMLEYSCSGLVSYYECVCMILKWLKQATSTSVNILLQTIHSQSCCKVGSWAT